MKFRAVINKETVIFFTFQTLLAEPKLFSIREILIPWLRAGGEPDRFTGLKSNYTDIYENDIVKINFPHHIRWIESAGCWNFSQEHADQCQVIGNSHQNPELLEGK